MSGSRGDSLCRNVHMELDDTYTISPLEALKRKRERDKENQRRKRQREREHTAGLEARIHQLEQQLEIALSRRHDEPDLLRTRGCYYPTEGGAGHGQEDARGHLAHSPPLRIVTPPPPPWVGVSLRSGQATPAEPLVSSRPPNNTSVSTSSPSDSVSSSRLVTDTPGRVSIKDAQSPPQFQASGDGGSRGSSGSPYVEVTISTDTLGTLLATPVWLRIPVLTFSPSPAPRLLIRNEVFESMIRQLRACPDFMSTSPVVPKVMDLLFGGSRNELANTITSELLPHALLPPERFATSWILYIMLRWLVAPSKETFEMIPEYLRPTPCQLALEHPIHMVVIPWPSLRDKLVVHWRRYNLEQVFGLLGCTCRIRGAFNRNFIVRHNEGEPQVDKSFYRRYMDQGGWGLLEKFWVEYPELVENLDRSVMIKEEDLL